MGDNLLRYPELDQAVIGHSRQEQGQDDVRTSKHDGKQACLCRADPRQVGLDYGLSWKWFGRPNHFIVARPVNHLLAISDTRWWSLAGQTVKQEISRYVFC
ncbi:hypothetical protein TIFTF001_010210 [Ficus carica]|uniref:Uncharacterized protein n=1 Tax=Ficus carica TaxID=3494 RepID=A0AA88D383_FICCA|nr:hypothetical protein TIFTF001_010210 [Ficus carica]